MQKAVFKPTEIAKVDDKLVLKLSHNFVEEKEEEEVIDAEPEYTGPTAEQLKAEADAFKVKWEAEKFQMLEEAKAQAEQIVKEAEKVAFEEVKRQTDSAQAIRQHAEADAAEIIKQAEKKSLDLIQEGEYKRQQRLDEAYEEGFKKGADDGFLDGKAEVDRLIGVLHKTNLQIFERRQEIYDEAEQQIIDLVLLIARKVVKKISEESRATIASNIVQALKKVKGRGEVTIRVNMDDLKIASDHKEDFMKAVESIRNITFVEDSSIEKGGCIVETDFGSIDARISSQFNELEQKVLEVSPIKTINKQGANTSSTSGVDL